MKIILILLSTIIFLVKENQSIANFKNEFCESVLKPLQCNPTLKYRPINGRCNNLQNPYLGAANTKFGRLMKARYSDGISAPPKSVTGGELPSARLISLEVFNDTNILNLKFTQAFMQFAQMIAHDISNILSAPTQRGCCKDDGKLVPKPDQNCLHISVPPVDENHSGMKCLDFVRSLTNNDMKCPNYPKGPAEQINEATASLDLSHVYGTSKEVLNKQRLFQNGMLAMEKRFNSTWPIHDPNTKSTCFTENSKETCYISGDSRINQNPTLSVMQILFVREHNRIALELQKLNPHWSDEILFQEARRINIAEFQYIAYYGWFFSIVGVKNLESLGYYFQPSGSEYANDYNATLDFSIFNEFPSGVFRLLHTTIDGHLSKVSESRTLEEIVRLSDFYHRPKAIEGYGNFDSFLRGMVAQPAQYFDGNYDEEVRSYLFRMQKEFGSDLKALDIQRGRDHGLPNYNELRSYCGLPRATKWEDFADHIPLSDIDNLKKVYADVDDVEFNVGSSLELPHSPNTMIGITYACILKIQVRAFRSGDRFWFENNDPAARFTPNQLAEIRKASFSRIICDNTESIFSLPQNTFLIPNEVNNTYVKCSDVPRVDLSFFKE
ncbi:unnamed protein product [Chironomus riparius]|uniref:Peroxidase n=1 Tax=Chironomus riparius TaxID=315576 RepID=A0A9N9S4P9_9DIPT|nr:unnamed protein product [Chironomus riparius]